MARDKYQIDLNNIDNYVNDKFSIKPLIKNGGLKNYMIGVKNQLKVDNNSKGEILKLKQRELQEK